MNTQRHIYGQGDLDGACFLYAIVNAHAALCKKAPEFFAVAKAFAQVDHPEDFLCGIVGTTGHYDQNYSLLQNNLERLLALLGDAKFQVRRILGQSTIASLAELVGPGSVAVVRYQGDSALTAEMDHWVCAVAHDAEAAFVACSVRYQKSFAAAGGYTETFHSECERWSNDVLRAGSGLKLVEGEVFHIVLL